GVNNGPMVARIRGVLVDDLAQIDPIGQDAIEMAAAEGPAAEGPAARAGVALGAMAFGLQGRHQPCDRAELRIAPEYVPHQPCLGFVDDELAVLHVVAEGWRAAHPQALFLGGGDLVAYGAARSLALALRGGRAAHPQALFLGGGDLVADALARDLALELREGQQYVQHQATH